MEKKKVIIVTDGDMSAKRAVEIAAINVGGRAISASAGNPTPLTGVEIIELVKKTDEEPVIVMVDDKGNKGVGQGEQVMETLLNSDSINIIGIVVVSSKGKDCRKLKLACSITKNNKKVNKPVNKYGNPVSKDVICGDTLGILTGKKDLLMVGIGDPGKMDYKDELLKGSPVTTRAIKEILKRNDTN
ncbi:stage V sporulation protein AE [Herbivorax sp. ANBcel31]|uniref:stage V sporulation protein AE n=1 Tax=Herbivorax sp. ANBcel31 TaxID=3069754 RepID=UPI0027B7B35C|nr:stage V sporulation protein AE [Herbivorax sp. ANBcel31]MDQ2086130.1 stage V sporulation protein AE [Herbivorax sp. ANBcel31]